VRGYAAWLLWAAQPPSAIGPAAASGLTQDDEALLALAEREVPHGSRDTRADGAEVRVHPNPLTQTATLNPNPYPQPLTLTLTPNPNPNPDPKPNPNPNP